MSPVVGSSQLACVTVKAGNQHDSHSRASSASGHEPAAAPTDILPGLGVRR
jgi:hypothetical protein